MVQLNTVIHGQKKSIGSAMVPRSGNFSDKSLASKLQDRPVPPEIEGKSLGDSTVSDDLIIDEIASATTRLFQNSPRTPEKGPPSEKKSA
jgi:hypothetical protein